LRGWGRYDFLPVYSLPPPPNGSLIIPPMSCHGRVDYTERRKTERKNVSNEHYITGPPQHKHTHTNTHTNTHKHTHTHTQTHTHTHTMKFKNLIFLSLNTSSLCVVGPVM